MTAKVLVVDAEDVICTLLAAMLRQYGCYQVVTTTDGRQVLDLLRGEPFDVVLLDVHMSAITGQDVLQQITQAFEELPVILVAGYGSMETAVASIPAGAADIVTTPVSAAILHLRIQKALEPPPGARPGGPDAAGYRQHLRLGLHRVETRGGSARPPGAQPAGALPALTPVARPAAVAGLTAMGGRGDMIDRREQSARAVRPLTLARVAAGVYGRVPVACG